MEKISEGITNFSLRLHRRLAKTGIHDNICLSPYSVFSSLIILYLGARGETAKQIANVLGLGYKSVSKMHELCAWLNYMLVESGTKDEELFVANQLFIHADIDIRLDYDHYAGAYYFTTPVSMSFATHSEGSQRRINTWVAMKTNGNIDTVILDGGIDSRLMMLSLNVAFFKGLWRGYFPAGLTYPGDFNISPNEQMAVEMLRKEDILYYARFPEMRCTLVYLPCVWTRGWMLILLPHEKDNVIALEKRLFPESFRMLRKMAKKHQVRLHMPKFRMESTFELSSVLSAMGLADLFNPGQSDLTGMVECPPEDCAVTDVIHKAVVEVDESGIQAPKTNTRVTCLGKSYPSVEMIIDRPFLFFVQDGPTETIIFTGRVMNPSVAVTQETDTAL